LEPEKHATTSDKPSFSFSEISLYEFCPYSFRLRNLLGFEPPLVKELGYGKALHHLLRRLADYVKKNGKAPGIYDLDKLFREEFYLAFASGPPLEKMRVAARKIVDQYLRDHVNDLFRVWETERTFELHLAHATINGRADVILDKERGVQGSMAILDYKTSVDWDRMELHTFQLQIYSAAARMEGMNVQNAYVHDLKEGSRVSVDIGKTALKQAIDHASEIADGIIHRKLDAQVGEHCGHCDVRFVCKLGLEFLRGMNDTD
jgi:DNA helicase-2/ATP-dependent DNA helicase PcrA